MHWLHLSLEKNIPTSRFRRISGEIVAKSAGVVCLQRMVQRRCDKCWMSSRRDVLYCRISVYVSMGCFLARLTQRRSRQRSRIKSCLVDKGKLFIINSVLAGQIKCTRAAQGKDIAIKDYEKKISPGKIHMMDYLSTSN